METAEGVPFWSLSIQGGGPRNAHDRVSWTDAKGNPISDFRAYWDYANRSETQKLPFGVWHLRLSHYRLEGEIKLVPVSEGCNVTLQIDFVASGVNMITVLGVDSRWSYPSNGRIEREYLEGLSDQLGRTSAEPDSKH